MNKQKDANKIWIAVKNILKKHFNTETFNLGSCLQHFKYAVYKRRKRVIIKCGSDLGPD